MEKVQWTTTYLHGKPENPIPSSYKFFVHLPWPPRVPTASLHEDTRQFMKFLEKGNVEHNGASATVAGFFKFHRSLFRLYHSLNRTTQHLQIINLEINRIDSSKNLCLTHRGGKELKGYPLMKAILLKLVGIS